MGTQQGRIVGRALLLLMVSCGGSGQRSPNLEDGAAPDADASIPSDAGARDADGSHDSRAQEVDAFSSSDAGAAPTAADILAKVATCQGSAIKSGFGLDSEKPASVSIYQCGSAVYWKADMDVDCDGIQSPPCDTDRTGQPQTSIVDDAPNGDVDPTLLPYFVIPLGEPETNWYESYGIDLGQVGAVIYNGQVRYGIFADEAGGAFIGEASYAMCQLFLGKPVGNDDPCDPNEGGIDPSEVTYVTFTGTSARVQGASIYDHSAHTAIGNAAARAWIADH